MSQNFLEIMDVTFAASKKNKVINVNFNFNERVQEAVGYLKVCHFHPDDEKQYDCMVNGVNQLNRKIIDERLLNILKSHDLEPEKA